jgi:hypothetical protein
MTNIKNPDKKEEEGRDHISNTSAFDQRIAHDTGIKGDHNKILGGRGRLGGGRERKGREGERRGEEGGEGRRRKERGG